jgi:hypothetical protein
MTQHHPLAMLAVSHKYQPPPWVAEHMDAATYTRYVKRMARGAFLRDVKGGGTYSIEEAADAIHGAVLANEGRDHWTGEPMRWDLLGRYDSSESALRGGAYKKELAMKPTIDHRNSEPVCDFVICAWRTNDAKHDMSIDELKECCRLVLEHNA